MDNLLISAIVTDIEGTTSSLAFVKDTLFPYAAKQLPNFVRQHANDPEVKKLLAEAAAEAGVNDTVSTINCLLHWIQEDRKLTSLKMLQGLIWAEGYTNGQLKGHIYADVAPCLRAWHAAGIRLYIYSSGSVKAQQLLFSHTPFGDLTTLFDGNFDTRIGGKREPLSYEGIVDIIGLPRNQILFLSDLCAELDAAHKAGMLTCQLLRDGVDPHPCGHPQAADFDDIGRTFKTLSTHGESL